MKTIGVLILYKHSPPRFMACKNDPTSDIIEQMGSYTEISPSGNGIRIIFTVDKFSYNKELYYINNHRKGLEVYIAGATQKFVTITGNKINDNPLIDGTSKLSAVLDKYMLRDEAQKVSPQKEFSAPANSKDFLQIGLEKDGKLRAYWNGARPHGNESEDDAGFMAKLLYWCNNDADKAIQAFCDSPYASQKDEKHQAKIKRLDYLPKLAKDMRPSRTAAQDNERWKEEHRAETSGTNGISGTMDTMFVLQKKARLSNEAKLYVTGRDVEQDELVIKLNENTCRWELVGHADELAELEKLENYQASPIVKTVRVLLDESPEKRWKGFAKNLLQECERLFEIPIEKSPQQVGKELCQFKDLLLEQDGIIYTISPNGNAGSFHHFCYDHKVGPHDDDEENVEF